MGFSRQYCLHPIGDVVWHERFSIILADVSIDVQAGLTSHVPEEKSRIVVFYHNSLLAPGKDPRNFFAVEGDYP
ncbi:MAG: hypothetical protein ACE5GH_06775, partial [Fidelibacterota bacterium]